MSIIRGWKMQPMYGSTDTHSWFVCDCGSSAAKSQDIIHTSGCDEQKRILALKEIREKVRRRQLTTLGRRTDE